MFLKIACILLSAMAICLAGSPLSAAPAKKLLIIGDKPDGHPPKTHEFMAGGRILADLLKDTPDLEVTLVDGQEPWEAGPDLIRQSNGVVLFVSEGGKWAQRDPRRYEALTQLASAGGGISALHWGIGAKEGKYTDGYQKLIGGIHGGSDRKYTKITTKVTPTESHPITQGIAPFEIKDEFYYQLKFAKEGKLTLLLQVEIEGILQTVSWVWERPDGGRSFGFGPLHFHENWQKEEYRELIPRAVLWTLKVPQR